MRSFLIVLIFNLFCFGNVFADVETLLIEKAKSWASRDRIDLARESLDKLFQINPDHPDGLARLAYIDIQQGKEDQAKQALKRLLKISPKHQEAENLKLILQMNAVDEKKLQQARLWLKAGQTEKAITAYDQLFPNGMPTAKLRYEYWILIGRSEKGWDAANIGLQKLSDDFPNSLRYQLAITEHRLAKDPSNLSLLKTLKTFLNKPNYQRQASEAWRRAVLRLDQKPSSRPYYEDYLAYNPDNEIVKQRLLKQKKSTKRRSNLLNNHAYIAKIEGLKLLEQGDLEGAEKKFLYTLKYRQNDTDASGGLGLIYLRQARYEQSRVYFSKARTIAKMINLETYSKWLSLMNTAIYWGLLLESDKLVENLEYVDAQKKIEQALKMERTTYALNKRAQVQQLQGHSTQAITSYHQVLKIDENNEAAIDALLNVYLEQNELDIAQHFLDSLSAQQKAVLGSRFDTLSKQLLLKRSDKALAQDKPKEAIRYLEKAQKLDPNNAWLLYDLAKLYKRHDDVKKALPLFEQGIKNQSENYDLSFAYALLLDSIDQPEKAVQQLDSIPVSHRSENVQAARTRLFNQIQAQNEDDLRLQEAARLAKIKEQERFLLLKQQQEIERKQLLEQQNVLKTTVEKPTKSLPDDKQNIIFSMDYKASSRDQSDGKSSVSNLEIPIEIRFLNINNGDVFIRLDYVSLDAGALDIVDVDEVSEFGQGLFCFPSCSSDASDESASGHYIGIGYEKQDFRIDIGTTPKDFLVDDIIGGLSIDGDWDIFSWGVDVSRRPLTGNKLTYAGAKDIHSGQVWGGIRATGVTLSLSQDDGEEIGYWSNFEVHRLTGKNVADNKRVRLMGGAYWRLIDGIAKQLSAGLNLQLWHHDKVLDEFTFGQAGYYSPNNYTSLSIPIDLTGRFNPQFSYRLKAAISKSWTDEERTAFFPNDNALQANAESIQGVTGISPYFDANSGGGTGLSLLAAMEYKIKDELSVGVEYATEKSDSYHPVSLLFYLRYALKGEQRDVRIPPTPLRPYSDF